MKAMASSIPTAEAGTEVASSSASAGLDVDGVGGGLVMLDSSKR